METALTGLTSGAAPPTIEEGFVETLATNAVQDYAVGLANSENFHLLQQTQPVALTLGVGTLPTNFIPESLKVGAVYDGDGNKLERLWFSGDLNQARSPLLGYYALVNGEILTKQAGSGSLTDTTSPLQVTGNIIPGLDTLATDVPLVIQSDLVNFLAQRIRTSILPPPAPNG